MRDNINNLVVLESLMAEGIQALDEGGVTISSEGMAMQVGGAIKDHLLWKDIRDSFRVGGWLAWDKRRVFSGIDDMEEAMTDFIQSYIDRYDLSGKKVPYDALDSTTAWRGMSKSALFLIDDKRYKVLKSHVVNGIETLNFNESVMDDLAELLTADEMRVLIRKEIATYEDFIKMYKKACKNARELITLAIKDTTNELPMAFLANHFVGLNGLVILAGQVRSSIRRAV